MENHNDWYINIVKEIGRHKDKFSKRDYKKYKLDLLLRMAKRVASFSADCVECQIFQGEITKLAEDVGNLVQASKEERKSYFKMINRILKHLQERRKLITKRRKFCNLDWDWDCNWWGGGHYFWCWFRQHWYGDTHRRWYGYSNRKCNRKLHGCQSKKGR